MECGRGSGLCRALLTAPLPPPGVRCSPAVLRGVPEGQAVRAAVAGTGPAQRRGKRPGAWGPSGAQPARHRGAVPLACLLRLPRLPYLPLPLLRLGPPPPALGSVSMAPLTLGRSQRGSGGQERWKRLGWSRQGCVCVCGRRAEEWGTGLSCVVVYIAKVPLAKGERGLKSSLHLRAKGLA